MLTASSTVDDITYVFGSEISSTAWVTVSRSHTIRARAPWVWPIAQPDQNLKWMFQPSDRHNRGANLSFADGHMAFKQWRWPKRLGPGGSNPAANALDLEALRWLQAGLPEPSAGCFGTTLFSERWKASPVRVTRTFNGDRSGRSKEATERRVTVRTSRVFSAFCGLNCRMQHEIVAASDGFGARQQIEPLWVSPFLPFASV